MTATTFLPNEFSGATPPQKKARKVLGRKSGQNLMTAQKTTKLSSSAQTH